MKLQPLLKAKLFSFRTSAPSKVPSGYHRGPCGSGYLCLYTALIWSPPCCAERPSRDTNSTAGLSVAVLASVHLVKAHSCALSLRNSVWTLIWRSLLDQWYESGVSYMMKAVLFSWLHSELLLSSYLITSV